MNFKNKINSELIQELKDLVKNERHLLMEILYRLREVEERKLHLEMGHSDIYHFAQDELGYSRGAAYRRISAMRLLKSLPEIEQSLKSGELELGNASRAQSLFRQEDLRRRDQGQEKMNREEKKNIVTELFGKSSRDAERLLAEKLPDVTAVAEEKIKPAKNGQTVIQFIASPELMEKLEQLKGLLAHTNFDGRMDVLIEKLADVTLQKLNPVPKSPAPGFSETRYIPTKIKAQVRRRDGNRCTYQDPKTRHRCASTHALQFDHIKPFSQGGPSTLENLRLLCGAHNRYQAEMMGLWAG
jgi:hypothetical protein